MKKTYREPTENMQRTFRECTEDPIQGLPGDYPGISRTSSYPHMTVRNLMQSTEVLKNQETSPFTTCQHACKVTAQKAPARGKSVRRIGYFLPVASFINQISD